VRGAAATEEAMKISATAIVTAMFIATDRISAERPRAYAAEGAAEQALTDMAEKFDRAMETVESEKARLERDMRDLAEQVNRLSFYSSPFNGHTTTDLSVAYGQAKMAMELIDSLFSTLTCQSLSFGHAARVILAHHDLPEAGRARFDPNLAVEMSHTLRLAIAMRQADMRRIADEKEAELARIEAEKLAAEQAKKEARAAKRASRKAAEVVS
jgi:hypothetical protein